MRSPIRYTLGQLSRCVPRPPDLMRRRSRSFPPQRAFPRPTRRRAGDAPQTRPRRRMLEHPLRRGNEQNRECARVLSLVLHPRHPTKVPTGQHLSRAHLSLSNVPQVMMVPTTTCRTSSSSTSMIERDDLDVDDVETKGILLLHYVHEQRSTAPSARRPFELIERARVDVVLRCSCCSCC